MPKGKRKGSKKRSKPSTSPEESPPKEYVPVGASDKPDEAEGNPDSSLSADKLAASNPSSLTVGPSKLEDIASRHRECRTGIVQNLSDSQISEVGVRIFERWSWFRQKLRVKLDPGLKKSKISTEESLQEKEKSTPLESSELPNMMSLINEEIESLEKVRLEVEAELEEESIEMSPEDKASEAWERYLLKKEAFKRQAILSYVISIRESVELMDRLTASMSTMKLVLRGSPVAAAAEPHPEIENFLHALQQFTDSLSNQSDDDSLQQKKPDETMETDAQPSPRKSPSPNKSAPL